MANSIFLGSEKDGLVKIGALHIYKIGDLVFWATASSAGAHAFIGHPRGDKAGKVLVLATGTGLSVRKRDHSHDRSGYREGE